MTARIVASRALQLQRARNIHTYIHTHVHRHSNSNRNSNSNRAPVIHGPAEGSVPEGVRAEGAVEQHQAVEACIKVIELDGGVATAGGTVGSADATQFMKSVSSEEIAAATAESDVAVGRLEL